MVANIDYFYNFDKMFGAYVGIGLGYFDYSGSFNIANLADFGISGGSFALPINVGFNFNVNESNTISLGAKVPVLGTDVNVLLHKKFKPCKMALVQALQANLQMVD
ncbi:hypothetical protein BKH43_03310 [Helicobacter sp. 13S00401-1]|uniref:outer membrane beta-barrel protein n=1 Tax=Helicobacter sp. 13S00401-1 TaxID=1905758 RepID=UPI000BA73073|nr:outer membrane beta-barrel protein [Helicobacter sp. 13S00401-1]PAF50898.1 hypothetical protein BKH43_03310 [Helicobacter sp. 13S00401-1]